MKESNKAADFWCGLLFIAIAVLFFVVSGGYPKSERGIGPGVYPGFVSVLLFVLGLIQVVRSVRNGNFFRPDWSQVNWRQMGKVGVFAVGTYVYALVVKYLGFLYLTPLYLYGAIRLFGYMKRRKAVAISIVMVVAVWFLFTKAFKVVLPTFTL